MLATAQDAPQCTIVYKPTITHHGKGASENESGYQTDVGHAGLPEGVKG